MSHKSYLQEALKFSGLTARYHKSLAAIASFLAFHLAIFYAVALLLSSAVHAQAVNPLLPQQAVNAATLRSQLNSAVLEGRWLTDLRLEKDLDVQPEEKIFRAAWQNNISKKAQIVRLALTEQQFIRDSSANSVKGYRLLTHAQYQTAELSKRIAAIWIEQDTQLSRFSSATDYERKIHQFLREYPEIDLSITAYQRQKKVFSRAFSNNKQCNNCELLSASASFELGDVSQIVAGLLAAKLEYRQETQAGVPLNLSLNWKTADLLVLMPSFHQHRAIDLMSHTACIPAQTTPITFLQGSRRLPAQFYAEQVWNQPMIPACVPGLLERKSTLSFLYLAAFLEAATGRSTRELISEELSQEYNLPSLSVSQSAPINVLGNGLVASSADLAALLASVLNGELIPRTRASERLWKRSESHNNYSFAWRLGKKGRVFSEHTGLNAQAAASVDYSGGHILVIMLRGRVDRHAFQSLNTALLDAL